MADHRSIIRSTDNRAEKRVAFRSPVSSVRSITPLSEMMQLESFRSPTRAQQPHQSSKRPSSGTPAAQIGGSAKRRATSDADPFPSSSNATLDDVIVKNTLRVEMLSEKVNSFGDQIPTIYDAANATLDKTADLVLRLHGLDNLMYNIVEQTKKLSQSLNKFLQDVEDAEEIDDLTVSDFDWDDNWEDEIIGQDFYPEMNAELEKMAIEAIVV